ncbi:MAG: hypothetical protein OEV78_03330 [Spirochaetia bacterium]|nr:hypothetical protein [Spirochaetia bacterium]
MFTIETDKNQNIKVQTDNKSMKPDTVIKQSKSENSFDYDLNIKGYGGGLFNYQSYNVNTPLIGAQVLAGLKYNITESMYVKLHSKTEARKSFIGPKGTKLTLDQYQEYAYGKFGVLNNYGEINFELKYQWMYRPTWPDLYQPNPLGFNGVPDPKYDSYLPTDRNSYQRISPELNFIFTKVENLEIYLNPGYLRNIDNSDPAFNINVPTHLTPSSYSSLFLVVGAKYEGVKPLKMELINKVESSTYDIALARDAITGKTHYMTSPNPLYIELNNKTTVALGIYFEKIKLEVKPIASLDFNVDQYQGYYSYTGFEPGIEIKQKIKNFQYSIKFSEDLQNYASTSFDSTKTLDNKTLYKYYTKASLDLGYSLSKNLEIFAEGDMLIKKTNYPPYVPGVNPATKNYDINFSFNNFSVNSGVTYKFK